MFRKSLKAVNNLNIYSYWLPIRSNGSFRTLEADPGKHSVENIAKFYQIPNEVKKTIFRYGGLPKSFDSQVKTFCETCIMVRKPAVDIIDAIRNMNFSKPAVRFVVYGQKGNGKSLCLAHTIHYATKNNFIIVHVPWAPDWMRRCKESSNSTTREGFLDLPIDSAAWLIHFRNQNQKLLDNPQLITSKEYIWSKREQTPLGAPITELIELGVNRVKYSSECVVALCNELKRLSTQGLCRTFVAIDGFNSFFYPRTLILTDSKQVAPPSKLTITEAFINLTKNDWCNGVAVVTVDQAAIPPDDSPNAHFPLKLLGKDGFEHVDPFIPIKVDKYSDEEFESCIQYYRDRLWIQNKENLEQQNSELSFLTGQNPYKLMQICASL